MSAYAFFAEVYDRLTQNVQYKDRAAYLTELVQHFHHNFGVTLDLACGTGSLLLQLKKSGVDVFGADASCEMLSIAQQKAAQQGENILLLCQKMQRLELYSTINTCLCTLDSINHLTRREDVQETFKRVSACLEPDGLFIFDVNTPYKHKTVLADNTFIFDTPQVYCVWQNQLEKDGATVDITLDFFKPEQSAYKRYSEHFKERAYTHEEITEMLSEASLTLEGVFAEMTLSPPAEKSERNVYVARKGKV